MVVENKIEYIVDMSNYFVYQSFSYGYSWMEDNIYKYLNNKLKKEGYSIVETINSPELWNTIGVSVFNMPYLDTGDGKHQFIVPEYSDLIDSDIVIQNRIGSIIDKLVMSDTNQLFINKDLKFFLYNDSISVEEQSGIVEQNIPCIIFNVLTVYMLRFIREKNKSKDE
jgi:hypothetical protein